MKKRIIALLLVLVMLVPCLVACGGNDGPDDGPNGPVGPDGGTSTYPWAMTKITFSINEDSDTDQLPSSSRRYLAGKLSEAEVSDYSRVDDYVTDRNTEAKASTNVDAQYQYLPDGAAYGWGENIQTIYRQATGGDPEAPDVYINFVYDMVAASLKGAFANLYSTTMYGANHEWSSTEYNYFEFENNRAYMDTGRDYMYEYMRSLTLSKHKMYCLSSDYFVDMVRAFFVVPVNIAMLEMIPVATDETTGELVEGKANSDRTGDGQFNIDDFYAMVWADEWNYENLAALSSAITLEEGGADTIGIEDRIGFALATGSGLPASGMLYTTSITIVKKVLNGSDYVYSYPNMKETATGEYVLDNESSDTTFEQLDVFCKNLADLVATKGVITVSATDAAAVGVTGDGADTAVIRKRFVQDKLLFGGVIVLGGLEQQDYLDMKGEGKKGYGIAPVPLYHSDGGDEYLTQVHNNGKIGAISVGTKNFAQCTAFLNYQSMHSNEVLNEYYNHKLRQTVQVTGTDENSAMLIYIRGHVRSSFDKAFEDALGAHYNAQTDGKSDNSKWHAMIKNSNFSITDMRTLYGQYAGQKYKWLKDLELEYNRLPS